MPLKYLPVLNLLERYHGRRVAFLVLLLLLLLLGFFLTDLDRANHLQIIKKKGRLVVLTRNAPTAVYEDNSGTTGFEYELLSHFAKQLGVELVLRFEPNIAKSAALLAGHSVDMIAAGRNNFDYSSTSVRFSSAYAKSRAQVLYKNGVSKRPKAVADLVSKRLGITSGLGYEQLLHGYKQKYPQLAWETIFDANGSDLLDMINQDQLSYAICDSREVALNQRYTPEVHVGFDLTAPLDISWKVANDADDSLLQAVNKFFANSHTKELLLNLNEQYFGHIPSFDYVNKRTFLEHVRDRLPKYKAAFMAAGAELDIDWRLLAAIGYQESHWNPLATSPTGVRGLMMLTKSTAELMQVDDRLDAYASIRGGSAYYRQQYDKLPEEIKDPDRTYLALAAYNIGYGHLRDAQLLAAQRGANPNLWVRVKSVLPLLRRQKYYQDLQHGFARGDEAVQYVSNIRDYYETLLWLEQSRDPEPPTAPIENEIELPRPFAL